MSAAEAELVGPLPAADVIETARDLEAGDEVYLAYNSYEWSEPLTVLDVDLTDADDSSEGGAATTLEMTVKSITEMEVAASARDKHATINHGNAPNPIYRFEIADEPDLHVCEDCGRPFGSERGKNIHRATEHDDGFDGADEVDIEASIDDDVADAATEDFLDAVDHTTGDDSADEDDELDDEAEGADDPDAGGEFPCDRCDKTFDTDQGRSIHRGHAHDTGNELSEGIDDELSEAVEEFDGSLGTIPDNEPRGDGGTAVSVSAKALADMDVEEFDALRDGGDAEASDPETAAVAEPSPDPGPGETAYGRGTDPADVLVDEAADAGDETDDSVPSFRSHTSSSGTNYDVSATCQNCGHIVSRDYARVFSPDGTVRCCPQCPDKIRDGNSIRDARSTRRNNPSARGGASD